MEFVIAFIIESWKDISMDSKTGVAISVVEIAA
jgi:hypothetical protein